MTSTATKYWNPDVETMARSSLDELQNERLRALVHRLDESSDFYRGRFRAMGIQPEQIRSKSDLVALPFTTKQDLRDHYPFGLLTVSRDEIVRVHASSGTTGKPTVVAYTAADMSLWAEVMARTLFAAGVRRSDIVHNAYGYGLFTGGLGFGLGSETIGAATVPVSGGLTGRQLMLLEDFGATALCSTPSYALVLAETAEDQGIDFGARMKLRVGMMGAEPWTDAMRREIEHRLALEAFDVYGLSEIIGPGVAVECGEHQGLHIFEDHFLPEAVDPETGSPLEDGRVGELVLTTLTKRGMPLLRYRTRDRVRLQQEKCSCGRTLTRMSKLQGRTDDMLVIRGVNVFPSQVEAALLGIEGLAPHYLIVVDRTKRLDSIEVRAEPTTLAASLDESALESLAGSAREALQQTLGIRVSFRLLSPREIPRSRGKAVRIMDSEDRN